MSSPYALQITINNNKRIKEFNDKRELENYLIKVKEVQKKNPHVTIQTKIIRKPRQVEDKRRESLCWEPYEKKILDFAGNEMMRCVPVPKKAKNIIYCPYCLEYKEVKVIDLGYGLKEKGCPDCEITLRDFYMRTANSLW